MCGLEHLGNCHGEWNFVGIGLVGLSSTLLLIRTKLFSLFGK